jgi:hypothetical protein
MFSKGDINNLFSLTGTRRAGGVTPQLTDRLTEHNIACMICGTELIYDKTARDQVCYYCGSHETSAIFCPEGHFVCDSCHSMNALTFLEFLADTDTSVSPIEVANKAMTHPSFKFHGPEHHSLVPAAVLIAMKNRGMTKIDGEPVTERTILEGIRRGSKIPGGWCGYAGACGACIGAGVAVALFIGSTPTRGRERTISHAATCRALVSNQDDLTRCCKRATYYGLSAAMNLLKEEYGIDLGSVPEPHSCQFSEKNRDCEKEDCPYYNRKE